MRLFTALLLALLCAFARAEELRVVTEEFPPLQYSENGKLVGPAAEVVEATLAAAGIQAEIKVLPWARALKMAHDEPNVLIFSIGRTLDREKQYKWVGLVTDLSPAYMYGLASRKLPVSNLDQARNYKIGTAIDNVFAESLNLAGFTDLELFRDYDSGYAMLKAGHIDLMPMGEGMMAYYAKKHGDDPNSTFIRQFAFTDFARRFSGNFMAFGLKAPDPLVARLRHALERIKQDGTYAAIQRKWRE